MSWDILFGLIPSEYHYLIIPASFFIIGIAIKYRLKEGEGYVGRLSMFSNSMALLSFYAPISKVPIGMILIIDFAIILGIIGIFSYAFNKKLSHENYYKYTRWFDSIVIGLLILIYYISPSWFT